MATNGVSGEFNRRDFLRVAAGAAVVLPGLLAACTPAAPATGTSAAATPGAATKTGNASALPSFIPAQNGPKPDYPSAGPQYEDGWDNFPASPSKSWTKAPPGAGSTINVLSNGFNPPATPFEQNPAWQEVNKQLNANVQFNVIQPADYAPKLATVMAGDDLPDLMLFPGGINVSGAQLGTANLPLFLQQKCADLTPYLAGDAVKDYPNLAAIPTFAWQNSGCAVSGHLYMLPLERYVAGQALFKNTSVYDAEIGKDYVPKNAEDLKKVYLQLNRPSEARYATASFQNQAFYVPNIYGAMFGAPNNWRLESNGKLTKNFETPEFKEALNYVRDLWNSGVFHPDTLNYADINAARLNFVAGRFVLYPEGFGQPWQDFWRRGLKNNPPYNFIPLPPFAAHDGGKPQHFLGAGFIATNALKKASPDRIKEILRIMDFLAAPFGTSEDLLLQYGLPDLHYTLDSSGKLTLTDRSNVDANYVNWKYIMQHSQVMYVPDIPGYAKAEYDAEHALIPHGVPDPTWGMYSPALATKGVTANRTMVDGITDIVVGRRPIADFDALVKDWQDAAGEQIRKELQDAIAQAKG
jgi:putative aldouronate transport system substrate-binding protein